MTARPLVEKPSDSGSATGKGKVFMQRTFVLEEGATTGRS
jgi:hypothetical protein